MPSLVRSSNVLACPAQGLRALRRAAVVLAVALVPALTGCGWFSQTSVVTCALAPAPAASSAAINLRQADGRDHFEVLGLAPDFLAELAAHESEDEAFVSCLAVFVGKPESGDVLPMLGEYRIEVDKLIFEPRYPLRPGTTYSAVCRVPDPSVAEGAVAVSQVFTTPAKEPSPAANVVAVYPTNGVLPENQLKFYLHFSGPMSRGEAYRRVHLFKASGEEVESPFLELGEELWDDTGTRFTLFFDPGRIKRGLKPREEVGPSLIEGESYALVVDKAWLDAEGRPLAKGFRKEFKAAAPDDVQPDVAKWKLLPPKAGTAETLTIEFNEPLDHAMLNRVLSIVDAAGLPVAGEVKIDQMETRWSFTPRDPWQAGAYHLVADSVLEDLAGNSLAKPFEVDVFNQVEGQVKSETVRIPFQVDE